MAPAKEPPVLFTLTIERPWGLYAFPEGVTPTDERGIRLGLVEVGQIIETGTAALGAELGEANAALAAANAELASLRDQVATLLRDKAVAGMKGT